MHGGAGALGVMASIPFPERNVRWERRLHRKQSTETSVLNSPPDTLCLCVSLIMELYLYDLKGFCGIFNKKDHLFEGGTMTVYDLLLLIINVFSEPSIIIGSLLSIILYFIGKNTDKDKARVVHTILNIFVVFLICLVFVKVVKSLNNNGNTTNDNTPTNGNTTTNDKIMDIPEDARVLNGHSYYLVTPPPGTWDDVLRNCASKGGYPAVINNSEEDEFLFNYMIESGLHAAFIGYSDADEEDNWKWVCGKESSYDQGWGINSRGHQEPNKESDDEDWAQMDDRMFEHHWNDCKYGQDTYAYFCEWDGIR